MPITVLSFWSLPTWTLAQCWWHAGDILHEGWALNEEQKKGGTLFAYCYRHLHLHRSECCLTALNIKVCSGQSLWSTTSREAFWSHFGMEIFGYRNDMVGSSKVQLNTANLGGTARLRFSHQLWKYQNSLQILNTSTYSMILLSKIFKQQQLKWVNPGWEWDLTTAH